MAGWNVGQSALDDMPHLVEAPLGGQNIPPPPGATMEGGGNPTMMAFPGLRGGVSPGHGLHHHLPAMNHDPHPPFLPPPHPGYHPAYPPHPAWHGYPHPHASPYAPHNTPLPASPWVLPQPGSQWGGTPWAGAGQDLPFQRDSWFPPSPSPWGGVGGFRPLGDEHRGRPGEVDWFAQGAHHNGQRARSQSLHRRKKSKSKSPFRHSHAAFPRFEESYFHDEEEEDDYNPWARGHHQKKWHVGFGAGDGGTDWDALDGGFGKLSLGEGHATPKRKRSMSFSGAHPLQHRRSASNPIYNGFYTTYEQHMQRNGYFGAREADVPYRPTTWRADYSVREGLMQALGKGIGFKHISDVKEINDSTKRNLHPHLQIEPNSSLASISLDLRLSPSIPASLSPTLNLLSFPKNPHPISSIDLMQFATHPPSSKMRLFHRRLPWYIDVVPLRGNGYITIEDIVFTLHDSLTGQGLGGKSQVTAAEYWCGEMGDHVESTPPPPPPGALPGSSTTPLLRSITPLPGLLGGGQRRAKHTAREQVSLSWRIRGRLAYHVEWQGSMARGFGEHVARVDGERAEEAELKRGVRRVDWLTIGANVDDQRAFRWIGLRKGRRGMWEIITEV
ncbi:hypothetical protein V5O48_010659 [Marasmius crinis-equi]|uniref:DUF6699 domain-containing protein n=1 Tax=Marasmius crinis-equi TaxID=585013 RepID=A0ABR3F7T3_9AGAR